MTGPDRGRVTDDAEAKRAVEVLGERLGHGFADAERALLALTHPSHAHEREEGRGYERLEFLGDAVLDLVVAEVLFEVHPDWDEGHLTRKRATLVRREALAARAREIGLPELLRLGRTELASGGEEKDSILANAYEAVIGALYLDGGMRAVQRAVAPWVAADGDDAARDAKTAFQEWAHAELQATPSYHTVHDSGVDADEQRFEVEVRVDGETYGAGVGRSKRLAERAAARRALVRRGSGA